jgi:hypothetical protein
LSRFLTLIAAQHPAAGRGEDPALGQLAGGWPARPADIGASGLPCALAVLRDLGGSKLF